MTDWHGEAIDRDSNAVVSSIRSRGKKANKKITLLLCLGLFLAILAIVCGIRLYIAIPVFVIYSIFIIWRYWQPIIDNAQSKTTEIADRAAERLQTGMASEAELSATSGENHD